MAKQFTDDNFMEEVVEASKSKPVLVDFFASWCGPCIMQGPIVEELAQKMEGKAVVGKLSTEDSPGTAMKFGVMSIPTMLVFKDGEVVEQMVGLRGLGDLEQVLEAHV